MIYDAAVIGAGVVGAFVARELSRYRLKVCLLEKEADAAMGTTKANSAIVHAGYDAKSGTLKSILNVRGNEMMEQAAKELGATFKRIGSLVLAFCEEDLESIEHLYHNGIKNKVPGLKLLNAEETAAIEPNISTKVMGAVRRHCHTTAFPTGCPVCRSHTTTVSLWLVMPMAAMSSAAALNFFSTVCITSSWHCQISNGLCSTQPGWG